MRFTFLGTGTSAGVPAIGCGCGVCTSADPRDSRLRTSACFEFTDPGGEARTVLIDAGPDLRQQVLRAGLSRLDTILFTHNHVDHTWGLDEVRRFNVVMDADIDVYGDEHTLSGLHNVYAHIFQKEKNVQESWVASLVARRATPYQPFDLFGLRVTPLALLHGRLPILGYRFDAADASVAADFLPMAYCTDVSGVPPQTWGHLTGLRTLVLDALRHRHHPTHYTVAQAVDVAGRIGADRTWFVHMNHELGHEETNAGLPEGMGLAWDGLRLG